MLSTLGKSFSRWHFEIYSYFSQKIGFWHFMQIVSCGDNLHEMSMPIFWENISKCRLLKLLPSMPSTELFKIFCDIIWRSNISLWLYHLAETVSRSYWARTYRLCPKYSNRQAWANSADPDQMLQDAASTGSTLFASLPAVFDISTGSQTNWIKF